MINCLSIQGGVLVPPPAGGQGRGLPLGTRGAGGNGFSYKERDAAMAECKQLSVVYTFSLYFSVF